MTENRTWVDDAGDIYIVLNDSEGKEFLIPEGDWISEDLCFMTEEQWLDIQVGTLQIQNKKLQDEIGKVVSDSEKGNPVFIRASNVEHYFGLKPQTIYQWTNDGKLIRGKHYRKMGKALLIDFKALYEYIKEMDTFNVSP